MNASHARVVPKSIALTLACTHAPASFRYGHRGAGLAAGVFEPLVEGARDGDGDGDAFGRSQAMPVRRPSPAKQRRRGAEEGAPSRQNTHTRFDDEGRGAPEEEGEGEEGDDAGAGVDGGLLPEEDEEAFPPLPGMEIERPATAGAAELDRDDGSDDSGREAVGAGVRVSAVAEETSEDTGVGGFEGDSDEGESQGGHVAATSAEEEAAALEALLGDPEESTVEWEAFLSRNWDAHSLAVATGRPAGGAAERALPAAERHVATHPLSGLRSAYAQPPGPNVRNVGATTGEPAATTLHNKYVGTVDYVWSTRALRCTGVLEPPHADALAAARCLPAARAPWSGPAASDHLPLLAEFEML